MSTQRLYMNVYRAGYYHRQGKPEHCNIHGGDCFTSEADALAHAEPNAGYIATVPFDMPIPEGVTVLSNPTGSEPTPLHVTRDNPLTLMPWHSSPQVFPVAILGAGQSCPMPSRWGYMPGYAGDAMAGRMQDTASLETSEDALGMSYEEWRRERERTGFQPAHRPHKVAALLAPPMMEEMS